MRKTFLYLLAGLMLSTSCKSRDFNSGPSDVERATIQALRRQELPSNTLGFIDYKDDKGRRAVRIYFKKVEGETDTYNTVIVEYPKILSVLPRWISTPKSEEEIDDKFSAKFVNELKTRINSRLGDLKHILARVTVYRTVPKAGDANAYELRQLTYDPSSQSLKVDESGNYSVLRLASFPKSDSVLAGATITASSKGEPAQITFPKGSVGNGIEWKLVDIAYSKAKLDSTWRDRFLTGYYLSTYGNRKNVILKLSKSGENLQADFFDAKSMGIPVTEFTNPQSARINGIYTVKAPQPGIFVFTPKDPNSLGHERVETKLGLFIDVFDATKSLNMDVVELVLVDASAPTNFHMYFEDPDNGEGQP